jgi:hypothetical protein
VVGIRLFVNTLLSGISGRRVRPCRRWHRKTEGVLSLYMGLLLYRVGSLGVVCALAVIGTGILRVQCKCLHF